MSNKYSSADLMKVWYFIVTPVINLGLLLKNFTVGVLFCSRYNLEGTSTLDPQVAVHLLHTAANNLFHVIQACN